MRKPFVLLWGSVAALFVFAWVYLPALSKYQDLKTRKEGMDIQVRELEKKVADAREERDLLKNDPEYLERVIRGELGLVKPGEVVYKFVEEESGAAKAVDAAKTAEVPSEDIAMPATTAATVIPAPAAQPKIAPKSQAVTTTAKRVAKPAPKPALAKPVPKPAPKPAVKKPVVRAPAPAEDDEPVYPRRETR